MAFLTALTGAVLGVSAVPAGAAANPNSGPPVVSNLWDSDGAVVVGFLDRSVDEDAFTLFRRGLTGSWEYVVETPTRDKPGKRLQDTLVDHSPNTLRCYAVVAYDNAGGVLLQGRSECVGGGSDPFEVRPGVAVAAPRVASLQLIGPVSGGTQVRINYVDRSRNESRFRILRRQGDPGVFVADSVTASRTSVGSTRAYFDIFPTGTNACYTVQAVDDTTFASNYSNEVCLTPPPPLPAPPTGPASARNVYTSAHVGTSSPDVAVGADGLPLVSLLGRPRTTPRGANLVVTRCNDAACTAPVSTELDHVAEPQGETSIAIGRDGLPLVTYASTGGVRLARCTNRACTAATLTTLDATARLPGGDSAEVSIGRDGLATITYADVSRPELGTIKVAHCIDAACTGATVTVIDTVPRTLNYGSPVTVATSPVGHTYVAYAAGIGRSATPENVVKVATCFNPACTDRTTATVDWGRLRELGSTGIHVSMAIGRDDLPLLTYRAHDDLVIAHCVNILCTGVTTTVVDEPATATHPGTAWDMRVAVGADGLGVVVYQGTMDLKVVHCADLACGGTNAVETVSRGPFSYQPSIAIGADGRPVIAYADGNRTVRMIHCSNTGCSGGPFAAPDPVGPIRGIAGKCVEVLLASTANGTPIQLRPCSGHVAQNWRVGNDGTLRALGKCLGIAGATTADAPYAIQLHDCNGHWAQVWEPQPDGTLRNPGSGKCLDTALHSDVDFIRLVLWACDSNIPSQIWELPTT